MFKRLQGNASQYISNIHYIKALVELVSHSDNKNELVNLDFYTHALNVKLKKITLGTKLLQILLNTVKILQKLPNGKKLLQNTEWSEKIGAGELSHPLHPRHF